MLGAIQGRVLQQGFKINTAQGHMIFHNFLLRNNRREQDIEAECWKAQPGADTFELNLMYIIMIQFVEAVIVDSACAAESI